MKLRKIWLILAVLIMAAFLAAPVYLQAQATEPTKLGFYINVVNAYPGQVKVGQDNRFFMEVRNEGNVPVNNITFKTTAPSGWVVDFQPASLETLAAGASTTVDINIIPDRATSRNYSLSIIAQANETQATTYLYMDIEGGISYWLWIGIGITVLVIAAFVVIFLRQNRQ